MHIHTSSVSALRIAAVATLMAMGTAIGCDVSDDDLSTDELELIEADLEEERIEELTVAPAEGEAYEGVESRIDALTADLDPMAFGFLNWHSEETPGASICPANQVVTGFDCSGDYCDNVRLECHSYGGSVTGGTWSNWFEHNGKASHVCPSGQKITGIDCWGDYCDNISIRCSTASSLGTNRCAWTNWYSDEDPSPFYADVGDAIQGMWCSGTHCDDKRFYVCEI